MHAAGAVGELAGGKPWGALAAERIFAPVGMTSTFYELSSPSNPRIAGGIRSTARDVGVFMEMLRNGGLNAGGERVLSAASVEQMFTRQTSPTVQLISSPLDSSDYGVGVWLDQRNAQGGLVGALAAGARGFNAWVDFDDDMTGVFATDATVFGNVEVLQYLIRSAAESAARNLVMAGDINLDGVVNPTDLYTLGQNLGRGGRLFVEGDFTGDGVVDVADVALAQANYYNPAAWPYDWFRATRVVPEPGGLTVLTAAGVMGSGRRRR
jgi:CubicO group peptidase (beta-lactamase class C family)